MSHVPPFIPADRAQNDFLRAGIFFFIRISGSPKRTSLVFDPFFAQTANFFAAPGVRLRRL